MVVSVVETVIGSSGNAATFDVVFTGTPADGEIIILCATNRNGSGTFIWPSGFVQSGALLQPRCSGAQAWKIASSESSGTYAIAHSGADNDWLCAGIRATGVNTSPVGVTGTDGPAGVNTVNPTTSATAEDDSLCVFWAFSGAHGENVWTGSSDWSGSGATLGTPVDINEELTNQQAGAL